MTLSADKINELKKGGITLKVILIVLDTARKNHLSCYGYEKETSPNIDKLASEGVVFTNTYASDVPTIPSFTALLSGQRGITTGVVSFSPLELLSDNASWLPTILAGQNYTTAAVSTLFHMRKWYIRGFHEYFNPVAGAYQRTQTVEAEEINASVIPWLKGNYQKDFFLFVHYWDPHVESVWGKGHPIPRYKAPEGYKELYYKGVPDDLTDRKYVISQYDANITYADKHIGDVLQTLDDLGIQDETMLIFTSDHGENLGEEHPEGKDLWDHLDIYEPVINVPLIFKIPGVKGRGKRIDSLVQNIDIAPTILDFLGMNKNKELEGTSLFPLIKGKSSKGYDEVYSDTGFATCKRAIITGDKMKLIKTIEPGQWPETPPIELYNLNEDPGEVNNLANEDKDMVQKLEFRMARWVEKNLGRKPDPLRLRANMKMTGTLLYPYYTYVYGSRPAEKVYTAKP